MNKNILAIAITAAVAAPSAFAAATVYGNAHMSMDSVTDGETRVGAIGSNSSYVGVKGSEDLAAGMKAVYQFEMQVAMDGDNGSAGVDGTTKGFDAGMRNTFVGLGGGFGTVLLGKHDTPLKMASRKFDLFGDRIGDTRNLTSKNGDAVSMGWDLRPNNVAAYVTPSFGGFSGILAYVSDEATQSGVNTSNGSNASAQGADAYSAIVMGAIGKVDLALAYENHGKAFSGIHKAMGATRLGASYDFGMVKLNAVYANQDTVVSGAIKERNIYGLGVAAPVGSAGTVKAQYYIADQTASGAKNGAGMLAVGYDHALSKSTTAYIAYANTNNETNASFNVAGGGHGEAVTTVVTGKDPSAVSVGVQHKF